MATPKRPLKTALHQAVLDGRLHQVRLLVERHYVDVDAQDAYGRTGLMLACLLPNEEDGFRIARVFMKAGAYPNLKDRRNRSAVHYASMKGRLAIMEALLKDDVIDVAQTDNDGNTPLTHAALSGNPKLVAFLVHAFKKLGMKLDERNSQGYTALLLACKYGHYASAYSLLVHGNAQPALRDNEFNLNASEWLTRSSDIQASLSIQRSRTTMATPPGRFDRENTLYSSWKSPQCHHVKAPSHPLGQSLDNALRLPPVFSTFSAHKPEENVVAGRSAQALLRKELDEAMSRHQLRSRSVTRTSRSRRKCPSTAKLLALNPRSHTTMFPDINTLFTLYSEQCDVPPATSHDSPHENSGTRVKIAVTSSY